MQSPGPAGSQLLCQTHGSAALESPTSTCTFDFVHVAIDRLRPECRARRSDPDAPALDAAFVGPAVERAQSRAEASTVTLVFTRRSLCLAGSPRSTCVFFCT